MRVGPGGYFEAVFCSDSYSESNMQRLTIMDSVIKSAGTPGAQSPSYFYFVGAYEAPLWTEAHYHAPRRRCGIPV